MTMRDRDHWRLGKAMCFCGGGEGGDGGGEVGNTDAIGGDFGFGSEYAGGQVGNTGAAQADSAPAAQSSFDGMGPSPNASMSEDAQRDSYSEGRQAAEVAGGYGVGGPAFSEGAGNYGTLAGTTAQQNNFLSGRTELTPAEQMAAATAKSGSEVGAKAGGGLLGMAFGPIGAIAGSVIGGKVGDALGRATVTEDNSRANDLGFAGNLGAGNSGGASVGNTGTAGAGGAGLDNGGNEGVDSASLQGGGLLGTAGGTTTAPGTSTATTSAPTGDVDYTLFGKLGMGGWTTAARKMAAKKSGAPA